MKASKFCAERLIQYFPDNSVEELANKIEIAEGERTMTELEALIQYWKDYRCSGLGLDEFEKVNNTVIYLETLQRLFRFGFVGITEGGK